MDEVLKVIITLTACGIAVSREVRHWVRPKKRK